ncbi:MAG: acyl-CoA/acyl-ACP dehydrogenase [Gemmatimonadetes bacterium]|nr:acyl-CoA/acyl-ACP dehydrogenase [Gemmatimonadota bacterium]
MSDKDWIELIHELGPTFEARAAGNDAEDRFVSENYADLKAHGLLAAAVPTELGGGGASHSQMCNTLRTIAQYCSSTGLANSMHQHLLAANIWKYRRGQGGEEMLRKVADVQPVLVSTGARDWLESNGDVERVEGGYKVSAIKHFASQSAAGDVLVTSAPYRDPQEGWQVLHFPIPFGSEGLKVLGNWRAMGMRSTGSHTVKLEDVFVPEEAVVLRRPQGEFHPFWNVILGVALPLIMSVYVGIAQKAARVAIEGVRKSKDPKPYVVPAVGAMHNELTAAELHLQDMLRLSNDLDFEPTDELGHAMLTRKTNIAIACNGVVTKAMELAGGQGFFRNHGLERLFRDVQAAKYHPLQEKDQHQFTGEYILQGQV